MDNISRITHSYIIECSNKEARNAYIYDFVRQLECTCEDSINRPCGRCKACIEIAAGTCLDVFHMEKSNKSGYSAQKDISPFIERLAMGSYGRYTIGIIDDASELNEISQNKLLKTLEEPSDNTVIIIGADSRDNLISTVCSRCQIVRVSDDEFKRNIIDADEVLDKQFYKFKENIDKIIKTQEDALAFLGALEDRYRESMIVGKDLDKSIKAIELIEKTRMDIMRGMTYNLAIKRLYLTLS